MTLSNYSLTLTFITLSNYLTVSLPKYTVRIPKNYMALRDWGKRLIFSQFIKVSAEHMCRVAPDLNKLGFSECYRENLFTFKFPLPVVINTFF